MTGLLFVLLPLGSLTWGEDSRTTRNSIVEKKRDTSVSGQLLSDNQSQSQSQQSQSQSQSEQSQAQQSQVQAQTESEKTNDAIIKAQSTTSNGSILHNLAQQEIELYSGTRIDVLVDMPFGINKAFADGKDCAFVNIETITPYGPFFTDEPFTIEKPDAFNIGGPTDSGNGSIRWCVTSKEPIKGTVVVKLRRFPQTQTRFDLDFTPDFDVEDRTDTNQFFFARPVTFIARIKPWMQHGLKEAKLIFVSSNCSEAGRTACQSPAVNFQTDLICSASGVCSATVPAVLTTSDLNATGNFGYTFRFTDTNNNVFQKTGKGTLSSP